MFEQAIDPRLESLLRQALKAEAGMLSMTLAPDQILERARARQSARLGSRLRRLVVGDREAGLRRLSLGVAAGATAIVVIVVGAELLGPRAIQPGFDVATPSPLTSATPQPTPTPTPTTTIDVLDTSAWTEYTSEQYGQTMRYPVGWSSVPATRAWSLEHDAVLDPASTGMDRFLSPAGNVAITVWSIPGRSGDGDFDLYAWAEEFCEQTANTGCTQIAERAVPMCLEFRDCHPALLVPYADDTQAYFTGGSLSDPITVAVVWRPEQHRTGTAYGGSRRLLEAFLTTMCVYSEDRSGRPPACQAVH